MKGKVGGGSKGIKRREEDMKAERRQYRRKGMRISRE